MSGETFLYVAVCLEIRPHQFSQSLETFEIGEQRIDNSWSHGNASEPKVFQCGKFEDKIRDRSQVVVVEPQHFELGQLGQRRGKSSDLVVLDEQLLESLAG